MHVALRRICMARWPVLLLSRATIVPNMRPQRNRRRVRPERSPCTGMDANDDSEWGKALQATSLSRMCWTASRISTIDPCASGGLGLALLQLDAVLRAARADADDDYLALLARFDGKIIPGTVAATLEAELSVLDHVMELVDSEIIEAASSGKTVSGVALFAHLGLIFSPLRIITNT